MKLLCDEVFGEENFVANIIWKKKTNGNNMGHVPPVHDFIVSYAKNVVELNMPGIPVSEEILNKTYKNPDNDERGPWTVSDLSANHVGPYFEITNPKNGQIHLPPNGRYWVFNEDEVKLRIKDGRIIFGKSGGGKPVQKVFLKFRKSAGSRKPETWWDKHGLNSDASVELTEILGEAKAFAHPKPSVTIKRILEFSTNKNALILDFFAGSGTTLHATMALNAEDGGQRRCILVTNNENNICEQVTYERNRRVMQGYTTPKGVAVPGLAANSLRYYRCVAPVPRAPTLRHRRELVRRATDLLCLKESCHQPLPGTPADGAFRAFGSPTGATVIVYDDLAVEAAAAFVAALPVPAAAPAGRPWCAVYVFAPGSYAYQQEFEAVAPRVRLSALPEALYRAWQHLLPHEGAMRAVEEAAGPVVADQTERLTPLPPLRKGEGEPDDRKEPDDLAANTPATKTDKRGNPILF